MLYLFIPILICVLFLLFLLFKAKQSNEQLQKKLNDQVGLIDERLKFADRYSKMLSLVAAKTVEACIITDKEGKVEWVNDAFTKITGYHSSEVIGKKPGAVLQGNETDQQTVLRISEGLRSKMSFKEEILNYHKSGRKYWLSLSITPVLDSNGEVEKFIAIETDITERKEFEKEIKSTLN